MERYRISAMASARSQATLTVELRPQVDLERAELQFDGTTPGMKLLAIENGTRRVVSDHAGIPMEIFVGIGRRQFLVEPVTAGNTVVVKALTAEEGGALMVRMVEERS